MYSCPLPRDQTAGFEEKEALAGVPSGRPVENR